MTQNSALRIRRLNFIGSGSSFSTGLDRIRMGWQDCGFGSGFWKILNPDTVFLQGRNRILDFRVATQKFVNVLTLITPVLKKIPVWYCLSHDKLKKLRMGRAKQKHCSKKEYFTPVWLGLNYRPQICPSWDWIMGNINNFFVKKINTVGQK